MAKGSESADGTGSDPLPAPIRGRQALVQKAWRLAEVIDAAGGGSEHAAGFTVEQWDLAARAAKVRYPSARVREITVEILRRREAPEFTDPFDGLT